MTHASTLLIAGLLTIGAILAPYTVVVHWPMAEWAEIERDGWDADGCETDPDCYDAHTGEPLMTPWSTPRPIIEALGCTTDAECEAAEATLEPWTWEPFECEDDCIDPESDVDPDEWCRQ